MGRMWRVILQILPSFTAVCKGLGANDIKLKRNALFFIKYKYVTSKI